jgi:hypothetical protein
MNQGLDDQDKIGAFDFGLRAVIKSALESKDKTLTIDNTQWKNLMNLSLVGYDNQKYTRGGPCLAYTFCDNHDTDYMLAFYATTYEERGAPSGLPYNRLILGYFIILFMPGYPNIYKFHYSWFKPITAFIMMRQILGIRFDSLLEIPQMDGQNYIMWKVTSESGTVYTFVILDTKKAVLSNLSDDKLVFKYPLPQSEYIEMRVYSDSAVVPIGTAPLTTGSKTPSPIYTAPIYPTSPAYPLYPTEVCSRLVDVCQKPLVYPNPSCNKDRIYHLKTNISC